MFLTFPRVFSLNLQIAGNSIRQVGEPAFRAEGTLTRFSFGRREEGYLFKPNNQDWDVLIVKKAKLLPVTCSRIVQADIDPQAAEMDLSDTHWLRHPLLNLDNDRQDRAAHALETLNTWSDTFSYLEESRSSGRIGLRPPQLGALHAIRAHWVLEDSSATIVLPTGTGKTETMLATLVSVPCSKILVIVPTDSLRAQLAQKFTTLGILKHPGSRVLKETARCPIVCMLCHIPTISTVNNVCTVSNVIVTTSSIAAQCSPEVQGRLSTLRCWRHCCV